VPEYANILVKVVILGVINRAPAAIPKHNGFCYSAVEHILTPSVNLAFGLKSGLLWLKLTPTCWTCSEYRTSREMY